jgi:hypothetical protein
MFLSTLQRDHYARGWWNADPGPRVGGRGGVLGLEKKKFDPGKMARKGNQAPKLSVSMGRHSQHSVNAVLHFK